MKMNEKEKDYGLVSIVIPAYNCEKNIKQTVKSVINQTYKNIEILIINDGSKDNTLKCIEELSSNYKQIKYYNNSNHGVAYSRNYGIKNATGKYLMFLDSDDGLNEDTILQSVQTMNNKKVQLVIFGMKFIDYKTNKTIYRGISEDRLMDKEELKSEYTYIFNNNLLSSCCNKLYITELVKDICFKEELQIYEDYCFVLDYLNKIDKFYILKEYYYNYYNYDSVGEITLSKRYRENMYGQIKNLIGYLNDFYLKLKIDDERFINNQFIYLLSIIYSNEVQNLVDKKRIIQNIKKYNNDFFITDIIKKHKKCLNIKSKMFRFLIKNKLNRIIYIILNNKG